MSDEEWAAIEALRRQVVMIAKSESEYARERDMRCTGRAETVAEGLAVAWDRTNEAFKAARAARAREATEAAR